MALLFFKETPELSQWGGILLILSGYGFFAFLALRSNSQDKSENIQLRFILLMFFSTILGTVSGGIDRYLLKTAQTPPETLLIWFSVYSLSILIIPATVYYSVKKKTAVNNMQWSWIIPLISIFLLVSDRIYFGALHDTESTLAVTGSLRRGSIIISVIGGGLLLKERNIRGKLVAACFVFAGLVFLKLFGE
jgi:transporter family protein